jgi:radical SAM superfamily enzyme YgiQ (UPF0313 family)
MEKPVIVVSFYDMDIAIGAKSLCAYLKSHGQPCSILHFGVLEPYSNLARLRLLQPRGFIDAGRIVPPTPELYAEAMEAIAARNPLLVGLNVDSRLVPIAKRLTELLAERLPDVPVIWGGIHPTLDVQHSLRFVNTVCVGEGEKPLLAMAEAVRAGQRDFSKIPGLSGRTPDGREYFNGPAPLIENLDEIPPLSFLKPSDSFHVPADAHKRMTQDPEGTGNYACKSYLLMASRGCVFSCSYCYAQPVRDMMGAEGSKFVRRRSMDHLFDELRYAKSLPWVIFIGFWDDIFVDDRRWLEEFAERYPREIGLPFFALVHPNTVNKKIVELLKTAGCHTVGLGIQSGSDRIARDLYRRHYSRDRAIETAHLLNPNFDVYYDLIINNPYETEEDIRETLELFLSFPRPFSIDTNFLLWFPGQAITARALADGVLQDCDIMGHGEEEDAALEDSMFRSGTWKRDLPPRQYSLYLLVCATQRGRPDAKTLRAWAHDDALLDRPEEIERRLLLECFDQAEREILELRAEKNRMAARMAGLEMQLERVRHGSPNSNGNGHEQPLAKPALASRLGSLPNC